MSLLPLETIDLETHSNHDQFIRIEVGHGQAIINGQAYDIYADDCVVIPAGSPHKILNVDTQNCLKLYTIYSPPEHPPGTIQSNKHSVGMSK